MYTTNISIGGTAVHKITCEMDLELLNDCEVELVFVHSWVFGEVKRVRTPKGIKPTTSMLESKPKRSGTEITATAITNDGKKTVDINATQEKRA